MGRHRYGINATPNVVRDERQIVAYHTPGRLLFRRSHQPFVDVR